MSRWTFEPGHTAAEFCVRHMMVTWVRGHFKNVHGALEFDPGSSGASRVEAVIDARGLWRERRARARRASREPGLPRRRAPSRDHVSRRSSAAARAERGRGRRALTIRGITLAVELQVQYLGQWQTPWWEDGRDKGPKTRAGFLATTRFNRDDFGVSWNSPLDRGGVVVGGEVAVTIDAEALLEP